MEAGRGGWGLEEECVGNWELEVDGVYAEEEVDLGKKEGKSCFRLKKS